MDHDKVALPPAQISAGLLKSHAPLIKRRMTVCSAILPGIIVHVFLHIILYVTVLGLRRTGRLMDRALHLLGGVANGFTGDFLNLACRFFDSTLNLIFVNHEQSLLRTSPANGRHVCLQPTMLRGAVLTAVGARSDEVSEFHLIAVS
jgi:hypothetical protein